MKYRKYFYFLISFLTLLIIWQLVVVSFNVNQTLFPTPISVLNSFRDSKEIFSDVLVSVIRLLIGSAIGITLAIAFGVLTGHISLIDNTFGQISNFLRFIPPLAMIPLFLVWFGIGEVSKIGLLAWTCFFPTWISVHNGVRNIENKYLLIAKSLKVKKLFFMKEIVFKGSMDYILNGSRIGVGVAFSVLVAAEMLGAYAGVGYRIFFLQSVYRIDRMMGYIVVLGIIGLVIDKLFVILSKRLTPWKLE